MRRPGRLAPYVATCSKKLQKGEYFPRALFIAYVVSITVIIQFIALQTTFLAPFMESSPNQSTPISDLVEVHEEPVAKWRNLQVFIGKI